MEKKLIDVSVHQGVIDWNKVKPNIDGVILRCGFGSDIKSQDDKQFKRNADECTRLGIPFGVYLYSYAKNADMAKSEAEHILRLVKGYKLSYPIYIDLEQSGCESAAVVVGKTVGDIIEKAGYWFGVYANEFWFNRYIGDRLDKYTKWCAKYHTKKPEITGITFDIWQYSSKGSIAGIKGNVDMNICYRDLVGAINGSHVEEVKQPTPTVVYKTEDSEQQFEDGHRNGKRFKTTNAVNLRNDAGITNTKVLKVLLIGTEVIWYGYYKVIDGVRWYYVVSGGTTGYVCGKYIK